MTPRRPIGGRRGPGSSRTEFSLISVGRLEVLSDSLPYGDMVTPVNTV
jgi:hypothetical protein